MKTIITFSIFPKIIVNSVKVVATTEKEIVEAEPQAMEALER